MPDVDSPFARALAEKDVDRAIEIAREDASVLDLKLPSPYEYERPLHAAVRIKSAELAEILLDHGSDVDIPDGEGYTPLFLAPELYAPLKVVKVLVERGADIHYDDDSPLWSAIWQASYGFGCLPIVRYLAKKGSRPRGLRHSAEAGNLRICRIVTELGADVNEIDEDGFAPLDYCTGVAHTFMKDHLKKKKSRDPEGVAAFLREQGARPSAELR